MASKLYELKDGRIIVKQKTDKENRLVYVLDDKTEVLAEKCQLKTKPFLDQSYTIVTEMKAN